MTVDMEAPLTHPIRIELEGVVRLLSQNLYPDRDVFLREMIQNAHDSIVRRRQRETDGGIIRVSAHEQQGILTIEDDGMGLTRQEIHDYLSTIGRSGTGEFKERLGATDPAEAFALIGQFGIGLLSAFLVADRVELETRHLDEDQAWRWSFDGGSRYQLAPGGRSRPGTQVSLHLKASARGYLHRDRLEHLIRRYADFIGVPVYVGLAMAPANAVHAPWEAAGQADRTRRSKTLLERRFPGERLLTLFHLDGAVAGTAAPIQGVLAISANPMPMMRGRVELYVSRMFISGAQPGLLPEWATFLRGVVQCDALVPTAARDGVRRDQVLEEVRAAIGEAVLGHLHQLLADDRSTLIGILRWHSEAVMALCLESGNEELFRELADLLPFRTAAGEPLTLPEVVARNPDGIRVPYFTGRSAADPVIALCRARGTPVLDLGESFAERFVLRYARCWPARLAPIRIDEAGAGGMLAPLPAEEQLPFRPLAVAACQLGAGDEVELVRFEPEALPALRLETRRGRSQRAMREVVEDIGLPDFLEIPLEGVMAAPDPPAVLYLNVANRVVGQLAARNRRREVRDRAVLQAILDRALVLSAGASSSARLDTFERFNQTLELLMGEEA